MLFYGVAGRSVPGDIEFRLEYSRSEYERKLQNLDRLDAKADSLFKYATGLFVAVLAVLQLVSENERWEMIQYCVPSLVCFAFAASSTVWTRRPISSAAPVSSSRLLTYDPEDDVRLTVATSLASTVGLLEQLAGKKNRSLWLATVLVAVGTVMTLMPLAPSLFETATSGIVKASDD
ncbi:hypothetical protein [Alienimonas californiensis]|uniref:hypothetical protein n=1 Tax=Alienimonas californiensis TaxID=2527989 RepID=UPI0011A266F5|nr:hypothetical protein [Alienimonas californiensis]